VDGLHWEETKAWTLMSTVGLWIYTCATCNPYISRTCYAHVSLDSGTGEQKPRMVTHPYVLRRDLRQTSLEIFTTKHYATPVSFATLRICSTTAATSLDFIGTL
jgi:hypothetical protein